MPPSISVLYVAGDGDSTARAITSLEEASDAVSVSRVDATEVDPEDPDSTGVDCVLVDWETPDGEDRLHAVLAAYPDVPCVVLTDGDAVDAERALSAGATDCLRVDTEQPAADLLATRIENVVRARAESSAPADAERLVDDVPDGVLVIDDTETVCEANESACEVLVDEDRRLVGRTLGDLVETGHLTDEFLAAYRDATATVSAGTGETVRTEFQIDSADGARRYDVQFARRPAGRGGVVATFREVTEYRQRTDKLKRYETLLETIPDTVIVTDLDGNHLDVHGFEGWSGYTEDELLEMNFREAIAPEHREATEEAARELWEDDQREKATIDIAVEMADGEVRPFENHFRFIQPGDDEEPKVLSILRDVSERTKRTRQLNALNETMRELIRADSSVEMAEQVVETARDVLEFEFAAVALYDETEDTFEHVASSPGAEELLDAEVASADSSVRAAYRAGEVKRIDDRDDVVSVADGQTSVRSEVIVPLGEYGVLYLGSSDREGPAAQTVSLAEMLAGTAEAALDRVFYREEREMLEDRERELDLYERAVEATTDGIAILNEDIEFLMVNSRFAEVVGETKEEVEGSTIDAADSEVIVDAPSDLTEQWIETAEVAREQGRSTFFYESTVDLPEGLRKIENRVTAVKQDDGSLVYVVTTRDITERKEREQALRERERALSRQIDRLDQFASILSHDLRNPLNVAQGHLAFLEEEGDDPEHVETVGNALDRMQAIIDDVLTLAREGDEATELSPVDLGATVETAWATVDTADATLTVDTDLTINADESRLQQLLENLVRNGIDHVGGDVHLRVGDLPDGFYVEDDGPGVPPEDRDRIFETGFSTSGEGTGFGLNIVRTIAEAHEWEVAVTEGTEGGARFEVTGVDTVDG